MLSRSRSHSGRISLAVAPFILLLTTNVSADVTGTVKFEGDVPTMKPLQMSADPVCDGKHKDAPALDEKLVLGPGNTMGNIFVQIKDGPITKATTAPTEPVIVRQHGCVYSPRVVGVMKGQPIKFMNEDGTLHNVHALPKVNRPFNLAMPATVTESSKTFEQPEAIFEIKCDVHPWMQGFAAVMDHPYFAITGTDGKFSIKGLAPGTYTVEAWHEKLGTKTATVTIPAGGASQTVDFTFTRPSKAG